MKKAVYGFKWACLVVVLAACQSGNDVERINQRLLVDAKLELSSFEQYAAVSRRPGRGEASQKMRYQQFLNQNATMDYLLQNDYQNDLGLKLDLIDKRSQLLLKDYYKQQEELAFTEQQIVDYYNDNIDLFSKKYAQVGKLKLRTSTLMSATAIAEKQGLAGNIQQQLADNRITFSKAVSLYAENPGRQLASGVVEKINLKLLGRFQTVVEALTPGAITDALKVTDGWVIYQLQSPIERIAQPLDEIKRQIRYRLSQTSKKAYEQALVQQVVVEQGLKTLSTARGLSLINPDFGDEERAAYAQLKGFSKDREASLQLAFQSFGHRVALADFLSKANASIQQSLAFLIVRNNKIENFHFKQIVKDGINDQTLNQFFETQKIFFNRTYVEVAAISIYVDDNGSDLAKEEALNDIQAVQSRLQAEELSFGEAVEQYSQDSLSNQNEGVLGRIEINTLPGQPQELLDLTPGDISSVQATPGGYTIYRLLSEPEQQPLPFDDAKAELTEILTQKIMQDEQSRLAAVVVKG